jgi:hypothetical protein
MITKICVQPRIQLLRWRFAKHRATEIGRSKLSFNLFWIGERSFLANLNISKYHPAFYLGGFEKAPALKSLATSNLSGENALMDWS